MNWEHYITLQIDLHNNINLLSGKHRSGFRFSQSTIELIRQINAMQFSPGEERRLLQFTVDAALSSFYKVNQYYDFDKKATEGLLAIYEVLLIDIKKMDQYQIDFDRLAELHYSRLQTWLVQSCSEVVHIFPANKPLHPVACAEYKASTQLSALGIDEQNLKEPILDIGCGKEHHLVSYLQNEGYKAYGFDREVEPHPTVFKKSWLEFEYGTSHWGTIISHLSFTNHFRHHHLKANSDHIRYAHAFIAIIQSLKPGGKFYYAPDLPFIEIFLDSKQYQISKRKIEGTAFYATSIERIY